MISIIIPAWNEHETTRECIEALRETTENFELILVDNGSDPPLPGATIRNERNLGFPAAVNQGIRAATGEVIALVNNDVILTPGWADRILPKLETFGIVGPLTNYCAGMQKAVIQAYENKDELYLQAMRLGEKNSGQVVEVNWIIGFCFVFRRSLFDELGSFDESMWPCSGEEIDFCYRAREKGYRIGIARDVYVHHEGSRTFQTMQAGGLIDYQQLCDETSRHIARKWGEDFWRRQRVDAVDGVRINLGCGRFHLPGFVNIDQDGELDPDVVADALDLPYDPGTVEEIYAGHLLEHFHYEDGLLALQYWYGLLAPGGKISVAVPDFDVLGRRYFDDPTTEALRDLNDTYIYSCKQKSPHLYAYSGALLKEVMERVGFSDLKRMPVDHPYFPTPVNWQVGYEGVKR